jgi:hypothetical protein
MLCAEYPLFVRWLGSPFSSFLVLVLVLSEAVLSETVLALDGCLNFGDAEYVPTRWSRFPRESWFLGRSFLVMLCRSEVY